MRADIGTEAGTQLGPGINRGTTLGTDAGATKAAPAELDATHDMSIRSWIDSANGHPEFPLQNLPLGIFSPRSSGRSDPRGGIRIGDSVLDLRRLANSHLMGGLAYKAAKSAAGGTLNEFFGLGAEPRRALRVRVHELLAVGSTAQSTLESMLHSVDEVDMHLPATVGDYTDFYVGINHAATVGSLFRPDNPLLPNYKWVPIGYHGRASSLRVSGEPFRRPKGQRKATADPAPTFGPARNLDFELEVGIWIGRGNDQGHPIPVSKAADHVAGYCLLNDWSARDIQAWEYQPLGPFLSKNFATTLSAWVVTPEALTPYRTAAMGRPEGDPAPLPYLLDATDQTMGGLDLELQVLISTERMRTVGRAAQQISLSSTQHMYWTVAQMIAHHTSGGCNLRAGDLLGSGTLSTPDATGYGSLLEMTNNGARALRLPSGEERTFLQDGDEIILRARAQRPGVAPIGFGECRAVVLPAI